MKTLTSLLLNLALVAASAVFAQSPARIVNGKGQGITDPAAFRDAIDAAKDDLTNVDLYKAGVVSASKQFEVDFERYADAASITHGTAATYGNALRMKSGTDNGSSGVAPYIANRGLRGANGSQIYIGSYVSAPNGRFSMAVDIELEPSIYPTATLGGGLGNISFNSSPVIANDGSAIIPTGVCHINFSSTGISQIGFYPGAGITCTNRSLENGSYPFAKGFTGCRPGGRYTIKLEVVDDELAITLDGVGTVRFTAPEMSDHIGPATHFWYEYSGDCYTTTPTSELQLSTTRNLLHRMWAMGEKLDMAVAPTSFTNAAGQQYPEFQFLRAAQYQKSWPGIDPGNSYALQAKGDVFVGGYTRTSLLPGVDFMAVQSDNVVTPFTTAASASGVTMLDVPARAGYFGRRSTDSLVLFGRFGANGNTKRIKLDAAPFANIFDSGDLTENGAAWKLTCERFNDTLSTHKTCSVDASTDLLTTNIAHGMQTGQAIELVMYSTAPGGLSHGTYYAMVNNATTFKVATSLSNALAGTAVDITSAGSNRVYLWTTPAQRLTYTVNGSTEEITCSAAHGLETGDYFETITGGVAPTNLANGGYYAIKVSSTVIKAATTEALAWAGTARDLTAGTGTQYIQPTGTSARCTVTFESGGTRLIQATNTILGETAFNFRLLGTGTAAGDLRLDGGSVTHRLFP